MRLVVTNLLQNQQEVIDLEEKRNYLIGRETESDIVLDSPFVSERQAILRHERDQVGIKPVGSVPVKVGGKSLPNHETYVLRLDDEIEIGQYLITLRDAQRDAMQHIDASQAQALHELEKECHQDLLGRLDLRKLDPKKLAPEEYRRLVEEFSTEIINNKSRDADGALLDYVTRSMLRDAMTQIHMAVAKNGSAAIPRHSRGFHSFAEISAEIYEAAVGEFAQRMRRAIDIEDLETWLDEHYEQVRYRIQLGMKSQFLQDYLKRNVLDTVFGLGPLEPLLGLPDITEIMVVHPELIYVERSGLLHKTMRRFVSEEVALSVIERIVAPLGLRVDRSTPLVDARLPDGSRVNVVIRPLAIAGPCITIRRFAKTRLTVDDLIREKHTMTQQAAQFLRLCVVGRKNLIISGGTGVGKTTLLNCLTEYIPSRERIVSIEDTAELQIKQEHVVSLEARPPNMQGKGAYTVRDLVKNALRMRPDRIIVGECRGSEALDMLQAMNTGHDGSMTTGHANSPADMMRRLETMVLLAADMPIRAIREQISSAINVVVQYTRYGDGSRKITQISEVSHLDPDSGDIILEDIFRYRYSEGESTGQLRHTGYVPTFFGELMRKTGASLDLLFDAEEGEGT